MNIAGFYIFTARATRRTAMQIARRIALAAMGVRREKAAFSSG
jgi:hypothetical protein